MCRRDSSRQKVYDAEWACPLLNHKQGFTLAQAQRWVNRFRKSKWARARWGGKFRGREILREIPVVFAPRLTAYAGQANNNVIDLGPLAMDHSYVMLHELSHVIISRTKPRAAPHGKEFLVVLQALVAHYIGREALAQFVKALEARGLSGKK